MSDLTRRREHTDDGRRATGSDLLRRCRAGDQQAWHELVGAYERLVYSVPRSYGLDAEDAADVTQATFALLIDGMARIRDDDTVAAWLGTVARRQTWRAIDRLRREREALPRVRGTEESDAAEQVATRGDPYDAWVDQAWLADGLKRLDPACRELLTALYLDARDASYQSVATRLGKAIGSIGPSRARCLARLRELMGAP